MNRYELISKKYYAMETEIECKIDSDVINYELLINNSNICYSFFIDNGDDEYIADVYVSFNIYGGVAPEFNIIIQNYDNMSNSGHIRSGVFFNNIVLFIKNKFNQIDFYWSGYENDVIVEKIFDTNIDFNNIPYRVDIDYIIDDNYKLHISSYKDSDLDIDPNNYYIFSAEDNYSYCVNPGSLTDKLDNLIGQKFHFN